MTTFGVLAFVFSLGGYVPYVRYILTSDVRPTLSTWISFAVIDTSIFMSMLIGSTVSAQMAAYIFGTTTVLLICLYKRASLAWTRIDTVCVAIVVASVALGLLLRSTNVTIVTSLVASVVSMAPLLRNVWNDPTVEKPLPWILVLFGSIFSILDIQAYTIGNTATPTVFALLQVAAIVLIMRRGFRSV